MNSSLKKNQVYLELRGKILSGELPAGRRLPGETALANQLGVSRVTLRAALDILAQELLIERVDRKGTFVAANAQAQRYLIFTPDNSSISNPHIYVINGIEKSLTEAGFDMDLCSISCLRSLKKSDLSKFISDHHVAGIFLACSNYVGGEPEIDLLRDCEIPLVIPHGNTGDEKFWNCPVMLVNFHDAFAEGVKYLISCGHRRIATLNLKFANTVAAHDFTPEEYRDFLRTSGADTDPALIQAASYTPQAVREAVHKWLALPEPPSAIICFSDFMAIYVYQALEELHIKIPDAISVMGFCGYPSGKFMVPSLSSIDFNYEQIGQQAVKVMLQASNWFHTAKQHQTIFTDYNLVTRNSVKELSALNTKGGMQ